MKKILCLVTDRRACGGRGLPGLVASAVAGGVDWVQLREKDLDGRELFELARAVAEAVGGVGGVTVARGGGDRDGDGGGGRRRVRLSVNRRLDVAVAAGFAGVHFGFDGLHPRPPELAFARAHLGGGAGDGGRADAAVGGDALGDAVVGVSAHSVDEVVALASQPLAARVDYVQLAPVFVPVSKAQERAPLGLAALAQAARAGLPVLAQGGVTARRAGACVAAGAAGVAVTGAILGREDVAGAAREIRVELDGSVG